MIDIGEETLVLLASEKLGDFQFQGVLNILSSAADTPDVQRLRRQASYGLAKLFIADGKFSMAKEALRGCAGASVEQPMQSLANERRRLLNQILSGKARSVAVFAGEFERAKVKPTMDLDPTSLEPAIWFVGAVGAYKSMYDSAREDSLSKLIRLIKHTAEPETLARLGELIADYIFVKTPVLSRADLLVPVPTSPERWDKRGYEIPRALAQAVSQSCAIPLQEDVVATDGESPELRNVPRWYRAQVIKGAYKAEKNQWIKDMSVVIIDDIITTGSTVSEIAQTLVEAGAKEVAAISLAHTERTK